MRTDARPPRSPAAALVAVCLALLAASPAAADVPVPGTLTISGRQVAGSKLTVDDTTPFGLHDSTYTWQLCDDNAGTNCAPVQTGLYGTTYRSLAGQAGKYLRVDALYADWTTSGTSSTQSGYFGPLAVHDATIDVPGDFATIQGALDDASNGDTIAIAAGTYNESPMIIGNSPGQATNLTITGAGASTTHLTGGGGFQINYAGPITMSGLHITHRLAVNETSGTFSHLKAQEVDAYASIGLAQTVTLDDVNVSDFIGTGVVFLGSNLTATLEHSTLTAASNGSTAVQAGNGATVTIDDNTIDLSPSSNIGSKGIDLPSGGPSTAIITGNTIDKAAFAIDGSAVSLLTISGNTITNTLNKGLNLAYSAANTQITDNVIHDGDIGIFLQTGAVITGNDIRDAATSGIQVWWSPGSVTVRGNAIVGNGTTFGQFTFDAGLTAVNFSTPFTAEYNWWGCNGGPGTAGCDRVQATGLGSIDADPWLVQTVDAAPNPIARGAATTVTVDFLHDSNGNNALAHGQLLGDLPVAFASTLGTPASASLTAHDGVVTQTLTAPAGSHGIADVTATTDNQTTHESVPMGNPASISSLTISGTAHFRDVLTANDTTTGDGITKTYTWEACFSPGVNCQTVGTNSSTYTVGDPIVGKFIRVTLHAHSPYGSDSATSSSTSAVTAIPVHVSVSQVSDAVGTLDVPVTGAPLGYTITVSATGNTVDGLRVQDFFPPSPTLADVEWTCTTDGASACLYASGSSEINDYLTVQPGHDVVFHVSSRVKYASSTDVANTAFVTIPFGFSDDVHADDSVTLHVATHQVVPVVTIDDDTPHYLDTLHASDDVTGSVFRFFDWYRCQVLVPSNCTLVASGTSQYTVGVNDLGYLIMVSDEIENSYGIATVSDITANPAAAIPVHVSVAKVSDVVGTLDLPVTGADVGYTVTVSAAGATVVGLRVHDVMTGGTYSPVGWTCTTTGSSACELPSSFGSIDESLTVEPGHDVVFHVSARFRYGTGSPFNNDVFLVLPAGYSDDTPGDDTATATVNLHQVVPVVTIDDESPHYLDTLHASDDVTSPESRDFTWYRCQVLVPSNCTQVAAHTSQYTVQSSDLGSLIKVSDLIHGGADSTTVSDYTDNPVGGLEVDLKIDKSASPSGTLHVAPGGSPLTYTVTVSSLSGPTVIGAKVNDALPAALTGATWTCAATAPSSCAASGSGSLVDEPVTVSASHPVVFTISGTVASGGTSTIGNTATVAVPSGYDESLLGDNQASTSTPRTNAPLLAWATGTNLAYTERAAPTPIDPTNSITVTDPDEDVTGATVVVGSGHGSGDTLAATTAGTSILATYVPGTWTLTLSGADTAAHYQQVLRSVTFENQLHNPSSAQRTITITVNDSTPDSATKSRLLDFTKVNEAPVVTTSDGIKHGTGVVDTGITVSDVDSANLSQATATVSPSAGVTLSAAGLPGGLNANYAAGTLTISGTASVANYQSALRLVTLAGGSSDVTVTFAATDDEAGLSQTSAPDDKHVDLDHTTLVAHGDGTSDTRGCGYAANPCDTIQHGVDNSAGGDTVSIGPGTYSDGTTTVDKTLTLSKSGTQPRIDVGAGQTGFVVLADNVVIDGLYLQSTGAGTTGIAPGNSVSGTTVRNSVILTFGVGIVLHNQGPSPFLVEDSNLTFNTVAFSGDAASSHVVIQNSFFNNGGTIVSLNGSDDITFDGNQVALPNLVIYAANTSHLTVSNNHFGNPHVGVSLAGGDSSVSITGNTSATSIDNAVDIATTGTANTGVTITGNDIFGGSSGPSINVHAGAMGDTLQVHRNRIVDPAGGVSAAAGNTVDATNNWWGCNAGPPTCAPTSGAGSVTTNPRLVLSAPAVVSSIKPGGKTVLHATVGTNSAGATIANPIPPQTISFGQSGSAAGTFNTSFGTTGASDGVLETRWTSDGSSGTANLTAHLDTETVITPVTVSAGSADGGADVGVSSFTTDNTSSVDATDIVDASIQLPAPQTGTLGIAEVDSSTGPTIDNDATYGVLGKAFQITAPDAPSGQFITLTFTVYAPGLPASQAQVWRDGHMVANCTVSGTLGPAPCVNSRTNLGGGKIRIVVLTDHASFWAIGGPDPQVVFDTGPGINAQNPNTQNHTPTFTFHAEVGGVPAPGALFECQITPDETVTTSCNAGTYTPAALPDGPKVLHVQANYAGIGGPINTSNFRVDDTDPTVSIVTKPALKTNSPTANFTWNRADTGGSGLLATSECSIVAFPAAPPPYYTCDTATSDNNTLATPAQEGKNTFTVWVTDNADAGGNTATDSYTWEYDFREPDTQNTGTLPGTNQGIAPQGSPSFATQSTTATFTFTGSDPAYSAGFSNLFECRLDGGPWVACNAGTKSYSGLAHGVHTFDVRAIDDVGNIDATPFSYDWFVDTHPPDVVPVYPYSNGRFSYYKDVKAAYSCDDHYGVPGFPSESGVVPITGCLGQVPVGTPFDHTSLGQPANDHTFLTYPFSITRTDKVGNTTAAPFNYRVFTFAGLVLDDNPKAYYRMDDPEGSDVLTDFSGNGNDGEYKNGTESGPIGVSGDGNTARVFTGADGYGFVNNMAAPTHGYTMAAFVQFDDGGDGMVMQHGRAGALFRRGNDLVFMNVAEDEEVAITVPGGIIAGCWYFVAGRFDRFHATVYAGTHDDGALDCTPTTSDLEWFAPQTISTDLEPSGDGSSFYVGYGEEAPWLHGTLDEVAYFDSILSPTHIKELWLADPPPGIHHVVVYSAPSSTPAPAVTHQPKPDPKIAAKARAKAKVKTLTKRLAAAKAHLAHIKRHHANAKQLKKAKRGIATLKRQLSAARRRA